MAVDFAFDVFGVVGHQRDAAHGGAAFGGEVGAFDVQVFDPFDVQVFDQGDGVTGFQYRALYCPELLCGVGGSW